MRRRRRRRIVLSSIHGFALRASPAVKHGVSPPGTVGERAEILCLLPSPRIVYSLADTLHSLHRLLPSPRIVYSLADTLHSLHHLPPSPHTIYGLADTLTPLHSHSPTSALASHRTASGGGAPCVTAGDTRAERGGTRGKVDSTNLRRWRRRTESVEKVSSISPPRKNSFLLSHYCQTLNTYIFSELYPKYDNVTT